jgi:DNA repair protein RadD
MVRSFGVSRIMLDPRPYQIDAESAVHAALKVHRYVLLSLPTGAGKTFIFSRVLKSYLDSGVDVCAIAHRQELLSQMSVALAVAGVKHKIITSNGGLLKLCCSLHLQETGKLFYDPSARCTIVGVRTLKSREKTLSAWGKTINFWVMDEAHHILIKNEWGVVAEIFPNARGLGVTATPERSDGEGLGADHSGIFDTLIVGPCGRQLIEMGYLVDYRKSIFAPKSDIDLIDVPISTATGDYVQPRLKTAVRKSHIVGDIVKHYLRIAPGKLGITFSDCVETAGDIRRTGNGYLRYGALKTGRYCSLST